MSAPIPRLSPPGCQAKGEQPGGSVCLRRERGRQVGDGRKKNIPLCRGNAAYIAIRAEKASRI